MNKVTVEFFHDVICVYCFPMSYQMRQLAEKMPEVEIVHRSYALIGSESDFVESFGSRAEAKDKIVSHWEQANQIDELHRINVAGMQKADFPFPGSMKGLTACKAAYFTGGSAAYWDVFDCLQRALFMESKNIEDPAVISQCVESCGIDVSKWEQHYNSAETAQAVQKDLLLAEQYGIDLIPCLVINGTHKISGALTLEEVEQAIRNAGESKEAVPSEGAACRIDGDKISCGA